ncbi:hypothetical protein BP5796_09802 [Coleophoma crateriformis]|uniref:Uncharacterized protein n=1 Tax=Coleophoma crateriformis TaxID=565419 RepID=A0A3D8QYZ6_9HELO|nr:hypothetical protein BP5796_09802 [Coleophoma crateriformis]
MRRSKFCSPGKSPVTPWQTSPMVPYQGLLKATTGQSFENISSMILHDESPTAAPYAEWIQHQIRKYIDQSTTASLGRILEGKDSSANNTVREATADENGLVYILTDVATLLNANISSSIDSLARALVAKGRLRPYVDKSLEQKEAYHLIFMAIGWLCLLYLPAWGIQVDKVFFRIEVEGKHCFASASQSTDRGRRPFAEVLRGFGSILPRKKDQSSIGSNGRQGSLSVGTMNAATLYTLGNIQISWTATVSAHLDFDEETRTLCLFRLPSFCVVNSSTETLFNRLVEILHDDHTRPTGFSGPAFLREIERSYHLIFRNDDRARRNYEKHQRPQLATLDGGLIDSKLDVLCGFSSFKQSTKTESIKDNYSFEGDFPIFTPHLRKIQEYMLEQQPRKMKAIWQDKMDLKLWYAFWTVVFFGVVGIILSLIQTICAAIQTAFAIKAYREQQSRQSSQGSTGTSAG